MYFDDLRDVEKIAVRYGTVVLVLPKKIDVSLRGAIRLSPTEKSTITIEQVNDVLERVKLKQQHEQFVVVRPAEKLGPEAANALLKTLEEPGSRVHFVLITSEARLLLPTILSRANIFYYRQAGKELLAVDADEDVLKIAKKLVVAKKNEIPSIAEKITSRKDGVKAYALEVLAVTIDVLYKSYLITNKEAFLAKIPKFLAAYDAIEANGHVKLHLVADLI